MVTATAAFHNEMTGSVGKRKAVDVVYLNFRKAFNIISHKSPYSLINEVWAKEVDSEMDWELAEHLGSKDCDQQHKVRLEASQRWYTPEGRYQV